MKKILTLIIITLLFFTSCQKFDTDEESNGEVNIPTKETVISDMSNLTISDSFDWKMIKTLDVEITIPLEGNHEITKIMSLDRNITYFNGYPEDNSNVLKSKITIPTYVSHVLVEYGNGSDGVVVSVEGQTTSLKTTLGMNNLKSASFSSLKATEPTFSCDVTVTNNVTNLNILAGNVYCIEEGSTITASKVIFKGGTLHVKGKLIVTNQITSQGNNLGYLYVSSTGEIDANKILVNKISVFNNFGIVTQDIGNSVISAGSVYENYGTVNCTKIINQSEDFLNEGTMNVDGQFNNNGIGENKGTINVTGSNGHFNNTGNPDVLFTNFCKIYVEQNFTQNSKFYHYGYLEVDKKTIITGSGNTSMVMGQFSLIVTEDLQITGEVVGPSELGAKFKVNNETKLTGNSDLSGYIQICDDDGNIEVDNGNKGANVEFACDWTIPENECNPGDNPPVDPPDPDPETFAGTLAFEDLWPGKGDYDINDLVITYDFEVAKNAQEKVEHVTATFEIRAFGANLHNGFGFSFPGVSPDNITSVTGYDIASGAVYNLAANGTEMGQTAATFIVMDDPFRLMPHPGSGTGVNTDHPAPYVSPVTLTLEIEFVNNAVTYSQLNIGEFNPFIVISQTRGMEVHLPDYPPTDLHDPSIFGTFADDTNPPGKYYMTTDNLPWAINIPAQYDYPVEQQIILGAYYHFAEWAQSSGTTYTDWYKDLPGYRNTSVIY